MAITATDDLDLPKFLFASIRKVNLGRSMLCGVNWVTFFLHKFYILWQTRAYQCSKSSA